MSSTIWVPDIRIQSTLDAKEADSQKDSTTR
jgi:hypothetical protein